MSNLKIGQRVRHTDRDAYSYGQVGVLLDLPTKYSPLVWVKFDDESYNNYRAVELGWELCTACFYNELEPIED